VDAEGEKQARNRAARAAGRAFGRMFAGLGGEPSLITSFDQYEAAIEAKKRQQARARKDLGLEPAPFVAEGCQGEPKPPE